MLQDKWFYHMRSSPSEIDENCSGASILDPSHSLMKQKAKRGRRSKFCEKDDLLILREVAAVKAHIALNGAKMERFNKIAARLSSNKNFCATMKEQGKFKLDDISGKKVRDRYERLQKDFDENDSKESRMSGVGGEVGLVEELLSKMREDREGERQRLCEKKERIKE